MKQVKAVLFDMDGVITDTMPFHYEAWAKALAEVGVSVNQRDIYKREGQKGIDSLKEIFADYRKPLSKDLASKILKNKENLFKKIFHRRFIIGSRPFLRKLFKKNIRLALVTGTSRHEARRLLPEDVWSLFEVIVCGTDVHNGKPHPEPYLKALNQLTLRPQEVFVIENAPFGIISAKTAGLTCIAIATSLPRLFLKQADMVVDNYQELVHKVHWT